MSKVEAEEFLGTDRFLIEQRIGAGGFGVVYKAYDRERQTQVALKTLRKTLPEGLFRFKKEFRSLVDLAHPNLISLYELISDNDQWFFTMELIDGTNFINDVRHKNESGEDSSSSHILTLSTPLPESERKSINEAETASVNINTLNYSQKVGGIIRPAKGHFSADTQRLREVLKQLTEGLIALHEAGKLHCDIKPSNVLVTKDSRVVLLDFGIVTEVSAQGRFEQREIAGTPIYMSPEQSSGQPLSEASDWYSVGIMLYEALAGSPPFTGSFVELMMAKQQSMELVPASKLISGVPADLDLLCQEMLRCDARLRPSGQEVLARLQKQDAVNISSSKTKIALKSTALLVGRESHLARLEEAFSKVREGNAVNVYISGQSGMGKSSLTRYFLDRLREDPGTVVLSGRCYEQESVPYKAFDGIIDALSQYLKHLSPRDADPLLPADILALAQLFPVLQQVKAIAQAERKVLEIPDSQELRKRAFAALRELLFRMARKWLIVLFIDDLQWGDIDSAVLIGELLRPPFPPPLFVIGCYRSEDAERSPFLKIIKSIRTTAGQLLDIRDIEINRLSPIEASELAIALFDKNRPPESVINTIVKESGGSPLFVQELVKYYQFDHNLLSQENAKNATESRDISLEKLILFRISQLPAEAQQLLKIVSVAGRPLLRQVAREITGMGAEEESALALLRAGHMIRARGSRDKASEVETYHDRIRETVVANLSEANLKEIHQKLAITLEMSGQADLETLLVHFQGAGDLKKTSYYASEAAELANRTLAFDRAARLYRIAISAGSKNSQALQIKLGDALANAGRSAEAAEIYLNASATAELSTLELQRRAAEQFLISGHIDEGFSALQSVLKMIGMKMPKSPRGALFSLMYHRTRIRLRGLKYKERSSQEISQEELLRIDTCWAVAKSLSLVDSIRGADFQARHLLISLNVGDPYRIARAFATEAAYSSASGSRSYVRTEQFLHESLALAKRLGDNYSIGITTLISGIVSFLEGRWKRAYELSLKAESLLRERCTGSRWELDSANYYILLTLTLLGGLKELSERTPALIIDAQERGDLLAEVQVRMRIFYLVFLAADEPNKAQQEARQTIERWTRQNFHLEHYMFMFVEAEIYLYCGEGKAAWDRIVAQWTEVKRSLLLRVQQLLIEAYYLRARCALAAAVASNDKTELLTTATNIARAMEGENVAYGRAKADLIRAGVASINEDIKEAVNLLALAEAGFETCDMLLHAAVARRRRGQLMNDENGKPLIESSDRWMMEEKIKNPARMANLLAPGKW